MEKSSFFNSVNGDRKYQASDFASYFNSLLTNGVFPNPSTNLQVIANNNMTVTVKAGKAWINGYCYINDSDLIIPIVVADGVLNRVDRIVVQFNTINRNITAKVKKGVFASTPIATVLQRDADVFELGIGDIYVGKGVTSISQANITDLRINASYCGWVNSLIQADTTAIFNQYLDWFTTKTGQYQADMVAKEMDFTNQFNNWFTSIQGQLSGDIAGNLLNQINSNSNKISILNGTGTVVEKVSKSVYDAFVISNASQLADMTKLARARDARAEGVKTPQWYIDNGFKNQTLLELNIQNNVGLIGASYCHISSTIPYHDTSGVIVQTITVVDGTRYKRWSTGATTWSSTTKVLDQTDYDALKASKVEVMVKYNATTEIDPNTTTESSILTNHANAPEGAGQYFYIRTYYFASISSTANRSQIAIKYNSGNNMYIRQCFNNVWTAWSKVWTNDNYGAIVNANGAFTLNISHASKVIYGGGVVTIPASVFPDGTQITFINIDSTFTFIPASGVYIRSDKRIIDGEGKSATLILINATTWALIGALK